jgi:hypothetical protein
MHARHRVISRTSVLIISFVLIHAALAQKLPPYLAVNGVLLGALGLIAYDAFKWVAFRRNRLQVRKLLILLACRSVAETCLNY